MATIVASAAVCKAYTAFDFAGFESIAQVALALLAHPEKGEVVLVKLDCMIVRCGRYFWSVGASFVVRVHKQTSCACFWLTILALHYFIYKVIDGEPSSCRYDTACNVFDMGTSHLA